MKPTTLEINIPLENGYMNINASQDPEYKGVDMEYVPEKENPENPSTRPRILIENPAETPHNLNIYVWSDPKSEDYTTKITINI